MVKTYKRLLIVSLFFVAFSALAGVAVMGLWNNLMPQICGASSITFVEGVGLFILGQIVSGGGLIAIFFILGSMHALTHHRGEMRRHWHAMTDEERREFIERRRREHFGFGNRPSRHSDGTE